MIAELSPIWFTARAAGTAALVLATLSVVFGLLHGTRALPKRIGGAESKAIHEALGLATLVAIAVHGLALALDPVLKASVLQLAVPFTVGYRPLAVGLGQIAGIGMAGLALTFYARRRLGPARWRGAHRFIPLFWAMGVAHGLLAGTDAGEPWFLAIVFGPVAAALALLAWRHRGSLPAASSPAIDSTSSRVPSATAMTRS